MPALDFILNCAALLLWLNGRSRRLTNLPSVPGIALIATLKSAQRRPAERWPSHLVLAILLLARAILYWQVGTSAHWMPTIPLGPITLHFRNDMFMPMLLFSLLGFVLFLAVFYFSLVILAAMNRGARENNTWLALIRAHLGPLAHWPAPLLLFMPFVVTFLSWLALGPVFGWLQVAAPTSSFNQLAKQALVIGLSAWLPWAYLIGGLFTLHFLASYVYFGRAPFWNFVHASARQLLRPFASLPLRVGKLDLAPLLGLALMIAVIIFIPQGLTWLYQRLAM
jgi:uncharacterized protein YggT (Ycf19 family)